jgi:hypothetical protein
MDRPILVARCRLPATNVGVARNEFHVILQQALADEDPSLTHQRTLGYTFLRALQECTIGLRGKCQIQSSLTLGSQ